MMAGLGPPLCRMYMVKGVATQKAKRKPVLSQFIAVIDVSKYSDAVLETGAKESHCSHPVSFYICILAPRSKRENSHPN